MFKCAWQHFKWTFFYFFIFTPNSILKTLPYLTWVLPTVRCISHTGLKLLANDIWTVRLECLQFSFSLFSLRLEKKGAEHTVLWSNYNLKCRNAEYNKTFLENGPQIKAADDIMPLIYFFFSQLYPAMSRLIIQTTTYTSEILLCYLQLNSCTTAIEIPKYMKFFVTWVTKEQVQWSLGISFKDIPCCPNQRNLGNSFQNQYFWRRKKKVGEILALDIFIYRTVDIQKINWLMEFLFIMLY